MPGPPPSHPSSRARQNKTSTAATLVEVEDRAAVEVPELPADRLWSIEAADWWHAVWSSPMVSEWDDSDRVAVMILVMILEELLVELRRASDPEVSVDTKRMQQLHKQWLDGCRPLGLNPMARRSLQWQIIANAKGAAEAESAAIKADRERSASAAPTSGRTKKKRYRGLT